MTKDQFCERFKAELLSLAGPTFEDGGSVAEYADEVAPTYFDDLGQREEGPEVCAQDEFSEWEPAP